MSLLTFPYVTPAYAPQVGAVRGTAFATEVTTARSGIERRRILQTVPRDTLEARWGRRDDARSIAEGVVDFFRQASGAALAFVAFDFDASFAHTRIHVGTTDGAKTVWNLPCAEAATSVTVYLDGVLQSSGFTLATGGANGRKKITFAPAPAAGKAITVGFTGQRAWVCRFLDDTLGLEMDETGLYTLSLRLLEVKGEE